MAKSIPKTRLLRVGLFLFVFGALAMTPGGRDFFRYALAIVTFPYRKAHAPPCTPDTTQDTYIDWERQLGPERIYSRSPESRAQITANYAQLKKGMLKKSVQELLGQPNYEARRVAGDFITCFTSWEYYFDSSQKGSDSFILRFDHNDRLEFAVSNVAGLGGFQGGSMPSIDRFAKP